MQPCIVLIGKRDVAKRFIEATIEWANGADIMLPEIRCVSELGHVRGKLVDSYVVLKGLEENKQKLLEQAALEASSRNIKSGWASPRLDTPDEFRRAVYRLRTVASPAASPFVQVPSRPLPR